MDGSLPDRRRMGRGGEFVGRADAEQVAAQAGVEELQLRRLHQSPALRLCCRPEQGDDPRLDERVEPDRRRGAGDADRAGELRLVEDAAAAQGRGAEEPLEGVDAVDAELLGEIAHQVVGDEIAHEAGDVRLGVGIQRREPATQEPLGQGQVGSCRRHFGMRQAIEPDQGSPAGKRLVGRRGEQHGPAADEHVTGRRQRLLGKQSAEVVDEPRREVDVVDDDRRRMVGEKGCGVEVGAGGVAGEGQRDASMERMEKGGKMGFPAGSWPGDGKARVLGAVTCSWKSKLAFDQNDIIHRRNRMICISRSMIRGGWGRRVASP